jgi:hypothetical protein
MRKWLSDVAGKAVILALAPFLVTGGLAVWGLLRGDARSWMTRASLLVWTGILGGAAVLVLVASWGMTRPRRRFAPGSPIVRVTRSSPWGYLPFEVPYSGVVWYCRLPRAGPVVHSWASADPDDVHVDGRPRCPRCKTELEERPRRLRSGYNWRCVRPGCAFTLRTRDSFAQTIERVEKNARRQVEESISAERAKGQDIPY